MLDFIKSITPLTLKKYYRHNLIDVYIISYPKCGRTWLRMLIGTALNKRFNLGLTANQITDTLGIARSLEEVPNVHFTHDDDPHIKPPSSIDTNKSKYTSKSIVFLIRDPRDVVVSSFYHFKHRNQRNEVSEMSISEFMRSENGGISNIVRFYNVWSENIKVPKEFLLLKYEDLLIDPNRALQNLFQFLSIPIEDSIIAGAIEQNSFERLKDKEKKGELSGHFFSEKTNDQKQLKVRKGKAGGYLEELSTSDVTFLDEYIQKNLTDIFSFYKYDSFSK